MGSIGTFGVAPDLPQEEQAGVEPETFTYFGKEIRLASEFNEVELVDLMEAARNVDERDPTAVVVIKDTLRIFMDSRDFDDFWATAKRNKQKIEDLAILMQQLMTALTDRPTQRPSGSSVGRSLTVENLPGDSPTPVSLGRPDLQYLIDSGRADAAKVKAVADGEKVKRDILRAAG
jgi:hypothetical protein